MKHNWKVKQNLEVLYVSVMTHIDCNQCKLKKRYKIGLLCSHLSI